jgi:hypothetical protein
MGKATLHWLENLLQLAGIDFAQVDVTMQRFRICGYPSSVLQWLDKLFGRTIMNDWQVWKPAIGSLAPARSALRALPALRSEAAPGIDNSGGHHQIFADCFPFHIP